MSVYSYIEVIEYGTKNPSHSDLYLPFNHGIHWSYQIAVAGGKRIYQGVQHGSYPNEPQFEELTAMSIYEQEISEAMLNYHAAIGACMSALRLNQSELEGWLREDLKHLFEAEAWYQKAWFKAPKGIVRLDWSESVWGASEEHVAYWDTPNRNYTFFTQLAADCEAVRVEKLATNEFITKYKRDLDKVDVTVDIGSF